jgi:GNAT superfamily N-acetyltransferase
VSLAARQLSALRAFYRLTAELNDDARIVELGDVQACVQPGSRVASIPNGVVYSDPEALRAALPDLLSLYGSLPWLVWLRPDDEEGARACAESGLRADGRPAFMVAGLSEVAPPRGSVEVEAVSWSEVAVVNERAYGLPAGAFTVLFAAGGASPPARLYGARVDGEIASVVLALQDGPHLGFYLVATVPEAQGRGLAGELMRVAAAEALARGLETTALEATAVGEPVYAGLGFRRVGIIQQYEHRL